MLIYVLWLAASKMKPPCWCDLIWCDLVLFIQSHWIHSKISGSLLKITWVEACYNHIWFSLQLCLTKLIKRIKTKPQWKLKPQADLTFKILSQILPSHCSCATQQKSLELLIVIRVDLKAGLIWNGLQAISNSHLISIWSAEQKNSNHPSQNSSSHLRAKDIPSPNCKKKSSISSHIKTWNNNN